LLYFIVWYLHTLYVKGKKVSYAFVSSDIFISTFFLLTATVTHIVPGWRPPLASFLLLALLSLLALLHLYPLPYPSRVAQAATAAPYTALACGSLILFIKCSASQALNNAQATSALAAALPLGALLGLLLLHLRHRFLARILARFAALDTAKKPGEELLLETYWFSSEAQAAALLRHLASRDRVSIDKRE
jgi:hypothetical protein